MRLGKSRIHFFGRNKCKNQNLARAARPTVESMEGRVMLSVTLPQFNLTEATTLNDTSVQVSYSITGAAVTAPLTFQFYRSSQPTLNAGSTLVGTQTLAATDTTDLSVGSHKVAMTSGTTLTPDVPQEYIVVVANANGAVNEAAASVNTAYFQTFMVGAISHGLELTGTAIPSWESQMASALVADDQYNDVIAFNWVTESRELKSGVAITAGTQLEQQVITEANSLASAHLGDVVDLQFIGHSRGAVVISQAMLDLVGTTDPALEGSYIKATFLDAHPASSANLSLQSTSSVLAALAIDTFEIVDKDPAVVIPPNVKDVEVYYEHTPYQDLVTIDPTEYSTVNLWGEGPGQGIVNDSSATIQWTNLTSAAGNTTTAVGHSEVPLWYTEFVVDEGLAASLT
jgi:hypothetical protein